MAKALPERGEQAASDLPFRRGYSSGREHLADELERIDLLVQQALDRGAAQQRDPALDPFRGLVITEEEVAALLAQERSGHAGEAAGRAASEREARLAQLDRRIERRIGLSAEAGVFLPLPYLAEVFELSRLEAQVVLLCLAVELDRKYEKLYAFLQDDVTSRFPSIDLVFKLLDLTDEEKLDARQTFSPKSTLMRYMLRVSAEHDAKPSLSRPLQLDERIVRYLLQPVGMDETMAAFAEEVYPSAPLPDLLLDEEIQERLRRFMASAGKREDTEDRELVFLLHGPAGAGKKLQIKHVCAHFGQPLLQVDLLKLAEESARSRTFREWLDRVFREAILLQGVLAFTNVQAMIPGEADMLPQDGQPEPSGSRDGAMLTELLAGLGNFRGVVFLVSEKPWRPAELTTGAVFIEVPFAIPENRSRAGLWRQFGTAYRVAPEVDWGIVAGKFRLTPGKIRSALAAARDLSEWANGPGAALGENELYRACYLQVQHKLERKAVRLTPRYTWDDVILPAEPKGQLRDACNQMKFRHIVYGEWGFERKLSYGKGLSMLFAGPPGTGKTMSAEIIASELKLDIYKIDLSQVISKYIGETEKNLQELFQEAQLSNAILFFDETDALFGKRSEVKSSHDKYANVEVAFLLQKMEEYEGISVLATNYLQNIDEAFMRRLNYVIKYPFPDAENREQIWRSMFPKEAPLAEDVDFRFLARTFQIAGGNIKNTVVSSAFLAAEKGEPIGMKHILRAAMHEIAKSGAIVLKEQLGVYSDLLD